MWCTWTQKDLNTTEEEKKLLTTTKEKRKKNTEMPDTNYEWCECLSARWMGMRANNSTTFQLARFDTLSSVRWLKVVSTARPYYDVQRAIFRCLLGFRTGHILQCLREISQCKLHCFGPGQCGSERAMAPSFKYVISLYQVNERWIYAVCINGQPSRFRCLRSFNAVYERFFFRAYLWHTRSLMSICSSHNNKIREAIMNYALTV